MIITILGHKIRVEFIILSILLIWFIHANTFFSCAGGINNGVNVIKEGFEVAEKLGSATGKASVKAVKKAGKNAAIEIAKEMPQ